MLFFKQCPALTLCSNEAHLESGTINRRLQLSNLVRIAKGKEKLAVNFDPALAS